MLQKVDTKLEFALTSILSNPMKRDISLSEISRWRIGGLAKVYVEPSSINELVAVLEQTSKSGVPVALIGETSNILFDSRGFDGVLIKIGHRLSDFSIDGHKVLAESGISVPQLVRETARSGLDGIIHAAGIPGTLGGLVVMNGGTQRRGIGEHVKRIWVADHSGSIQTLSHDQLDFSYRNSSLKGNVRTVLRVELELQRGTPSELLNRVEAILEERARKFPQAEPNCGSTFLSDPVMYDTVGPPGRAIEQAGLKGLSKGGAQISPLHANFIVNKGGACDDDVLWLISTIRQTVKDRTGFLLNCEVLHMSPSGVFRPAHEVADERWPYSLLRGEK